MAERVSRSGSDDVASRIAGDATACTSGRLSSRAPVARRAARRRCISLGYLSVVETASYGDDGDGVGNGTKIAEQTYWRAPRSVRAGNPSLTRVGQGSFETSSRTAAAEASNWRRSSADS